MAQKIFGCAADSLESDLITGKKTCGEWKSGVLGKSDASEERSSGSE